MCSPLAYCKYNEPMPEDLLTGILSWSIPLLATLVFSAAAYWGLDKAMSREPNNRVYRQLGYVTLVVFTIIVLILALPFAAETQQQLLSLFGLVLTAVIGLSSTTFVSNAMAGLTLKAMRSFRTGDFIRVADHFGRVTAKALLHTELQSEDRDVVTLPNMYVMTNPVQVVDQTGTLISAEIGIGYDVHRRRVRDLCVQAAQSAGLGDPFVRVLALGDFAVTYKVTGFLEDVGMIVSKRSELQGAILDTLHRAGIEIMTPGVMAQRPLEPSIPVIPKRVLTPDTEAQSGTAERLMFDKAELAARIEGFREQAHKLATEIKTLRDEDEEANALEVAWREHQLTSLNTFIEKYEADSD